VPEDAEMADLVDKIGHPDTVTISQLAKMASGDFRNWLEDRRNSRLIPHRLEACGYVAVRNNGAKDGLWKVADKRQVIYAKVELTPSERSRKAAEWAAQNRYM
jgi:hypothetical protein